MSGGKHQPPECGGIGHRDDLHAARRHIRIFRRPAAHDNTPPAKPLKARDKVGDELRPLRLRAGSYAKQVNSPHTRPRRQSEPRQQPNAMNPQSMGKRERHVATQPAKPDIRHQACVETPDETAKDVGYAPLNPLGRAGRHVRMKLMSDENACARARPHSIAIIGHDKVGRQAAGKSLSLTVFPENRPQEGWQLEHNLSPEPAHPAKPWRERPQRLDIKVGELRRQEGQRTPATRQCHLAPPRHESPHNNRRAPGMAKSPVEDADNDPRTPAQNHGRQDSNKARK